MTFDLAAAPLSPPLSALLSGQFGILDFRPVSRQIQTVFADWLLLALTYLWAVLLVSLGVYALTMKGHSSRHATIIIKVLGVLALLWDLRELFATTATLMRGLSRA